MMKLIFPIALLAALLPASTGWTQDTSPPPPASTVPDSATEVSFPPQWTFSGSLYTYFVPEDDTYAQPTLTADREWLHLEARYNYEDLQTGSLWVGYNFSIGDSLSFELTPMLGGVVGETYGVAPGFKGSLSWWWLELYGEGEYVFDLDERSDSFFYCWTELTLSPVDWFRAGLVAQRTRVYETDFEVQRGFLVGLNYKSISLTGHLFNPDDSKPTFVLAVALEF